MGNARRLATNDGGATPDVFASPPPEPASARNVDGEERRRRTAAKLAAAITRATLAGDFDVADRLLDALEQLDVDMEPRAAPEGPEPLAKA